GGVAREGGRGPARRDGEGPRRRGGGQDGGPGRQGRPPGPAAHRDHPAADRETEERCRDQALQILRDLIKAGWKDRAGLEADPDFAAVRDAPRFKELLAALAKASPPP